MDQNPGPNLSSSQKKLLRGADHHHAIHDLPVVFAFVGLLSTLTTNFPAPLAFGTTKFWRLWLFTISCRDNCRDISRWSRKLIGRRWEHFRFSSEHFRLSSELGLAFLARLVRSFPQFRLTNLEDVDLAWRSRTICLWSDLIIHDQFLEFELKGKEESDGRRFWDNLNWEEVSLQKVKECRNNFQPKVKMIWKDNSNNEWKLLNDTKWPVSFFSHMSSRKAWDLKRFHGAWATVSAVFLSSLMSLMGTRWAGNTLSILEATATGITRRGGCDCSAEDMNCFSSRQASSGSYNPPTCHGCSQLLGQSQTKPLERWLALGWRCVEVRPDMLVSHFSANKAWKSQHMLAPASRLKHFFPVRLHLLSIFQIRSSLKQSSNAGESLVQFVVTVASLEEL